LKDAETGGGRILAINIHPWVLGQPHRIQYLERVLEKISGNSNVWSASVSEIEQAWKAQQ